MIHLSLPLPPSVNHYYRPGEKHGRRHISDSGRAYRAEVGWRCAAMRGIGLGRRPVKFSAVVHFPDSRRRDLDNVLKATLDALQHAQMYADDSQIVDLRIQRGAIDRDRPRIEITLEAA